MNHRFLAKIENHSNPADFLIEDILTLSRFESGGIGLELRDINLGQLVDSVLDSLREMAGKRGSAMENDIGEKLSLFADSQRVFKH